MKKRHPFIVGRLLHAWEFGPGNCLVYDHIFRKNHFKTRPSALNTTDSIMPVVRVRLSFIGGQLLGYEMYRSGSPNSAATTYCYLCGAPFAKPLVHQDATKSPAIYAHAHRTPNMGLWTAGSSSLSVLESIQILNSHKTTIIGMSS